MPLDAWARGNRGDKPVIGWVENDPGLCKRPFGTDDLLLLKANGNTGSLQYDQRCMQAHWTSGGQVGRTTHEADWEHQNIRVYQLVL